MPFLWFSNKDVCLQTPRKDVALKFNVSSRAVGKILLKRKEIEADLRDGINPKRKRVELSLKTAATNQKVIEIVEKCNTKSVPVSGVQIREAAKEMAATLNVETRC